VNWYTSTHPDSLFVRNLIVTQPGPQRRHTLFNDKFTVRHCDGGVERRALRGAEELGEVLAHYFGITALDPAELEVAAALAAERAVHPDFFERG
jgi:N-hydroxyarylamine O-acetyltransferase